MGNRRWFWREIKFKWCKNYSCIKCTFREADYNRPKVNSPLCTPVYNANGEFERCELDSVPFERLRVKSVNYCISENGREHRTSMFDLMQSNLTTDDSENQREHLVIRRGQSFKLRITFNRYYRKDRDAINFIFSVADDPKPNHGNGTFIPLYLKYSTSMTRKYNLEEWNAVITKIDGDEIWCEITPSSQTPVAEWRLDIDTQSINVPDSSESYAAPCSIFILFNPWCRDDQVFLSDKEKLEEYVLSDTTLIWRGSYNRMKPAVWKLGQFDRDVLKCCFLLISEVGKLMATHRNDAVRVSRCLSAVVNSPDDDGAVMGNWSDDFSGGTPPTKWIGSAEILQKFYKKHKPVKYGQCWVFAGVLTTICRALGIPSRIITNYSSAHDTHGSLTVDYFIDQDGQILEQMNSDSIWNYHVWNEVWMKRPDIGNKYDGWQVIDATPQEMSNDSTYSCGPTSVMAIKRGETQRPYDCKFVYAEVNADKLIWRYAGPGKPLKLLKKNTNEIGLFLSTKAVGKWLREDITSAYKYPEFTNEERDIMVLALREANSSFSRYYLNEEFNEIQFRLELNDDIIIGQDFNVTLKVFNKSSTKTHTIAGKLSVDVLLYTGQQRKPIKGIDFEFEIKPKTSDHYELPVLFTDYFRELLDQSAFNISCFAKVVDTDYDFYAQDDFRVRKPDIKIIIQGEPVVGEPINVLLRVLNPLPIRLHKGVFQFSGPGIEKEETYKVHEVPVNGTASAIFKFIPPSEGTGTLVAKFTSKELDDVDGFLEYKTIVN